MEPTVVTEIEAGIHDNILTQISTAALRRQRSLLDRDPQNKRLSDPLDPTAELKRGDTIIFNSTISPKYLVGKSATVEKVNPKSVVVSCPVDPAYGRFSGNRRVRCPKSLIEGRIH